MKLSEELRNKKSRDNRELLDRAADRIDELEASLREQREGEWIAHEDGWGETYYTCSACRCDWITIDGTPQENFMRFCPECGANMKGGAE